MEYLIDPLRSAQKSISSISQKEKRNVLITSAGKRVVLVNIFKAALNRRDPALKVFNGYESKDGSCRYCFGQML